MKSIAPPTIILDYIRENYQYDPFTGIITKDGLPRGTRKKDTHHILIAISIPFGVRTRLTCQAYAHQIAWFLTHDIWAEEYLDHINGDPTDNRLANLRLATFAQNTFNQRKIRKTCTSQYKGVFFRSDRKLAKPWRAYISHGGGKRIELGHYATEEEAARAYDVKARELFGEYARLNFP